MKFSERAPTIFSPPNTIAARSSASIDRRYFPRDRQFLRLSSSSRRRTRRDSNVPSGKFGVRSIELALSSKWPRIGLGTASKRPRNGLDVAEKAGPVGRTGWEFYLAGRLANTGTTFGANLIPFTSRHRDRIDVHGNKSGRGERVQHRGAV